MLVFNLARFQYLTAFKDILWNKKVAAALEVMPK
jgi:hypothetical protein